MVIRAVVLYCFQNEPVFIVGHHLLHGKLVKLSKPFAVLKRVRNENGTDVLVTAVIQNKIIFRTRPKPIIWMQDK